MRALSKLVFKFNVNGLTDAEARNGCGCFNCFNYWFDVVISRSGEIISNRK